MTFTTKEIIPGQKIEEVYQTFERIFSEVLKEVERRAIPGLKEKLMRRSYSLIHNDPRLTFKENPIYLVGLNPGGNDATDYSLEIENADFWKNRPLGYSAFLDEVWQEGREKGKSNLQLNVQRLISEITGQDAEISVRNIFSTNMFFYRTSGEEELKEYPREIIHCWDFHEQFIKVIKPRIILCNGNGSFSAFSEMERNLKRRYAIEHKKLSKTRNIKYFETPFDKDDAPVRVIGIPHLSQPYVSIEEIILGVKSFINK